MKDRGLKPPVTLPDNDRDFQRWCQQTGDQRFISGSGDPNGTYMGNMGQVFLRSDTGDIYKKTSNDADTGWVAL